MSVARTSEAKARQIEGGARGRARGIADVRAQKAAGMAAAVAWRESRRCAASVPDPSSPTGVRGKEAVGDFGLVHGLRNGRKLSARLLERVRAFIADPPASALATRKGGRPRKELPKSDVPRRADSPTGAELADRIEAFAREHGLAMRRVGIRLFNGEGAIERLRQSKRPYQRTIDKVEAFLAALPSEDLKKQPSGGARQSDNGAVSGAELAAELDALIEKHRLSKTRVGKYLFNQGSGVETLRRSRPQRGTVDKIRELLAHPPIPELTPRRGFMKPRPSLKPPAPARPRRDPTQKPETPLTDLADRQRLSGQRHAANVRRSQEAAVTAKLDAGKRPANSFERGLMNNIEQRRADEARQGSPVEQAKLALQRKGLVVYSATVTGGQKDRFIVSGQQKELTPAELIDLAEKKTGQSFRRAA